MRSVPHWLHEHDLIFAWIIGIVAAAALALPGAAGFEWFRKRFPSLVSFLDRLDREPEDVSAESLVRKGKLCKASGRELIKEINRGALALVARGGDPSAKRSGPSPLEIAWRQTSFNDHAQIAASFISPRCTVAALGAQGAATKNDALGVLAGWVNGPAITLRGEIRGDTGVGKTMLIEQLFVDLARSNSKVVPMLASADNIQQNSSELERLKLGKDHLYAFVAVWLKIRRIVAKTEIDKKAMIELVARALEQGDIILLLDEVDELKEKGAASFVDGLLDKTKRWIVTRRYEDSARLQTTGHIITLQSSWNRNRIMTYVQKRLAGRPEATERVGTVLDQLIREKDTSSHWLSNPSNLRAYIDEVAPAGRLATEPEMYRLAESAIGLMDKLVSRDMQNIPNAEPTSIREALSTLALCKPGDGDALRDSPIGKTLAGMKTLLREDGRSLVFRFTAQKEYFLARRLAGELCYGPSNWKDAKALQSVAEKPWGTARFRLVVELLRTTTATMASPRAGIATWLSDSSPICADASSMLAANGKRNLLEVWKALESADEETDSSVARNMNLEGMDGQGLDLNDARVESCTFARANLCDAEMMHARFLDCVFAGADLTGANVIGAAFENCSFGEGDQFAKVKGMEIEGIQITPPELEARLSGGGARSQRSRYRGKFGEQFLTAQRAFLGRAAEDLEKRSYVPAIREAIQRAINKRSGQKVFLIDLMAGGQGGRSEELLAEFPQLHILSIDRDSTERVLSTRHQWMNVELGARLAGDRSSDDPFGLATMLREGFAESGGKADLVIAKKALHEVERRLQPKLIQTCGVVLQPSGRLVLFVDAPGAEVPPVAHPAHERAVENHEELRKLLVNPVTSPIDLEKFVTRDRYEPNPSGEWLFVNDWIAIKDWANSNLHELTHRYFASMAEIREWADPLFGKPLNVKTDWYDINALRFNERGVNYILHFMERHKENRQAAVREHRAMLAERLAGAERFQALLSFTRFVFDPSSTFARMMRAKPTPVQLADIEPLLAPLETAELAPQFELKCGVMQFERLVNES